MQSKVDHLHTGFLEPAHREPCVAVPHLRTLGTLELAGAPFRYPKPLLLLAYLSRVGPQPRKRVATLFWPHSHDPLNRLSVMLSRIRRELPTATWTDGERLGTSFRSDLDHLEEALAEERWDRVAELYRGPYLDGVYLRDPGEELEDWLVVTADEIARRVQLALLSAAEAAARVREIERATELAEAAAGVAGGALDAAELQRLHALLTTGGSPVAIAVRREAASGGMELEPGHMEPAASAPATRAQYGGQSAGDVMGSLAMMAVEEGRLDAARSYVLSSLRLIHELGIERDMPAALDQLACVSAAQGRPLHAASLWGAAEELRVRHDITLDADLRPYRQAWVDRAVAATDGNAFAAAWSFGRSADLQGLTADAQECGADLSRAAPGGAGEGWKFEPEPARTASDGLRRAVAPPARGGGVDADAALA